MLTEVKKTEVRKLYPVPSAAAHKGDNGRVLIVGGSLDYYGAPILCGMGALFGGVDLITLMVPQCNFDVARTYYPDFIVRQFPGDTLDARAVESVVLASREQDAVVIGPGLGDRPESVEAVLAILKKLKVPVVVDAQAIQAIPLLKGRSSAPLVVTPHAGELGRVLGQTIKQAGSKREGQVLAIPTLLVERAELVRKVAKSWNATVLLKGPIDVVASHGGEVSINQTGNSGMTVGGTGDVLAGFVAGLLARGLSPYDAARVGVFILCTAGDELLERKGHAFTATDLAHHLPYTIRRLTG